MALVEETCALAQACLLGMMFLLPFWFPKNKEKIVTIGIPLESKGKSFCALCWSFRETAGFHFPRACEGQTSGLDRRPGITNGLPAGGSAHPDSAPLVSQDLTESRSIPARAACGKTSPWKSNQESERRHMGNKPG
jgi:hypothetical protein